MKTKLFYYLITLAVTAGTVFVACKKDGDDDTLTGVYIEACGITVATKDLPGEYYAIEAADACPAGWRLPTITELECMCESDLLVGGRYVSSTRTDGTFFRSVSCTRDNYGLRCYTYMVPGQGYDEYKCLVRCVKDK